MQNLVSIFLLILLTLPSVMAADFQKGVKAANSGDFVVALKEFRPLAEQGHARAQFNLGVMYDNGYGVAEDNSQAVYWYRKAAEQGIARAQFKLGAMYAIGEGVAEDFILSYKWSNLAAAKGIEKAKNLKITLRTQMSSSQIAEAQRLSREMSPNQRGRVSKKTVTLPVQKQNNPDASGSSFVVSLNGHILTNRHVVKGCGTLRIGGQKTRIVSEDLINDLALLRLEQPVTTVASFREGKGVRVGDKVVVAGFPLRGLLGSGLNVTFGNVSSLTGIGNDSRMIQISAPVNPGNSGGPLIDDSGHIVGIVTSKLNALRTAKATGDIPQGANFAIKSSIIRIFLDLNNVDYETARSRSPSSSTVIADEAKKYTLLIECWK